MARNFVILAVFVAALSALFFFAACAGVPKPTGVSIDASEAGIEACIILAKKQGCACPADAGAVKPEASAPDTGIAGR